MKVKYLLLVLIFGCYKISIAQDLSKYQSHELYPYLLRSKQILDRLEKNIKTDSVSSDSFIQMDAEAERNEYQFLTACLRDELEIIDNNSTIIWNKFNVLNYGADPTGVNDSRQAFINVINDAKNYGKGAEIWIPKGTYSFSDACQLYGLNNMKFTADNALFIFTGVSTGLDVRQCKNFEVTGVSIDYKQLPWTQGTLLSRNGNDIYVQFDNGYLELQNWHNASLRFYDPSTKLVINSAYRWTYDKPNAQKQSDGSWKLPSLSAINGRMPINSIPIGSKVVILSRKGEDAYHYGLQYPSDWTFSAINLIGDEYVTFRNVNVYAAWESDIAAMGTNSGIRYININIEPKPGTDRLICGNSDSHVHYSGRKGDFIYNSRIISSSDDGCDYANLMTDVLGWQTNNSFLISGSVDINWTPLRVGDGMWIVNPQDGPYRYFAKVTNVQNSSGNQTLITLDRTIPQNIRVLSGNMVLGVNSKFDGLVILNNEWKNGTANGIYLYCANAVVENNLIEHFFYNATLLRVTTPPFWTAGGVTRNFTYVNNSVTNDDLFVTEYDVPNPNPSQCLFRNLNISNNIFIGKNPLILNYVSNSVISNNKFSISAAQPININHSCGNIDRFSEMIIPSRIEAEDYSAYYDSDNQNVLGQYRNDGVDIESTSDTGGGYDVGYIATNEWLQYAISVPFTYNYNIKLRVSGFGGKASIKLDGQEVIPPTDIPSTGAWQTWVDVNLGNIIIPEGKHTLQIFMNSSQFNLNYMQVAYSRGPDFTGQQLITAKHSSMAMSTDGSTNVFQHTYTGDDYQKWTLTQVQDGVYEIKNIKQDFVLDISGAKTDNQTNVDVYNDLNQPNQRFGLLDAGNGYYYVIAIQSAKNVEVFGATMGENDNISIYQPLGTDNQKWKISSVLLATQSSVNYGGTPSLAIDGNISGDFQNSSVTHTLVESNPWWTLDSHVSQPISQLKLYNRTDCCSDRLHDFYVFVSDSPFASTDPTVTVNTPGVWSYYYPGIAGSNVLLNVNRSGRYVRVQIPGSNEVLSLAEVVFTSGETPTVRNYSGKWDFTSSPEGWALTNALSGSIATNVYDLTITASDPYLHSPNQLNLDASTHNYVTVRLKNQTSDTQAELYWITNANTNYEDVNKHVIFTIKPNDNAYTDYSIDLGSNPNWTGIIKQIRIDPSRNANTGEIDVDYIGLDQAPQCSASVGVGGSTTFCQGSNVVLTSSSGASYKWMNGTTQVGTAQTFTATSSGSYTVEVTNAAGCKATSAATVLTASVPTVWYADTDHDGKGDANTTQTSCTQPSGYVSTAGDACPTDANKLVSGNCGCGNTEQSCLDCAGVPNGTAVLDVCMICSGGTTGRIAVIDINLCKVTTGNVSISKIEEIKALPNPFSDKIDLIVPLEAVVQLFDASGKLVYEGSNIHYIETSHLSNGLYLLRISTSTGVSVIKIEKQ